MLSCYAGAPIMTSAVEMPGGLETESLVFSLSAPRRHVFSGSSGVISEPARSR